MKSWKKTKLEDITISYAGGTPLRTNLEFYNNGTIPWIKSGEVNKKYIYSCEEKITEKAVKESSAKFFPPDSILVAMYGATAGQTAISKIKATSNQAVLAVNSKDKETLNEYIYYLLSFLTPTILLRSQGSGQPNLSKQIIDDQELDLPPLPEQKKIAEILTSVDRVIELTSMEIDKLKDLKKGMMQELLTKGIGHTKFKDSPVGKIPESWEVVELDQIASKITNGFVGTATPFYTDQRVGIPYIRGLNVRPNRFDDRSLIYITREFHLKQERSILKAGDLLTVQSGHNGQTCVVPSKYEGANAHAVIVTSLDQKRCIPNFVAEYINSDIGIKAINYILTGSTIKHINVKEFKNFFIPLPSLKEQLLIVEKLNGLDRFIQLKSLLLLNQNHLKKSLMNDLLTGKVRVKV